MHFNPLTPFLGTYAKGIIFYMHKCVYIRIIAYISKTPLNSTLKMSGFYMTFKLYIRRADIF